MAVYKRGETWWYEFIFAGKRLRESAKTGRKTVAIEAERRRRLELEKTLAGIPAEGRADRIKSVSDLIKGLHRGLRRESSRGIHYQRSVGAWKCC